MSAAAATIPESEPLEAARRAPVFMPREHGSWSLALEPLALGLLVAPSAGGLGLAVAAASGFFARRPARALMAPCGPGARRASALALAVLGCVAAAGLAEAAALGGLRSLWPLLACVPLGGLFLLFDMRKDARAAAAEIAGAATFSVLPAALATQAGWPALLSLGLAGVMCARSVPTVLVVRFAVRSGKGQSPGRLGPVVAALVAVGLVAELASLALVPRAVVVLACLLALRTALLVSLRPAALAPRALGLAEAFIGVAYIAGTALAYRV